MSTKVLGSIDLGSSAATVWSRTLPLLSFTMGGELLLASAPGEGTHWQLSVGAMSTVLLQELAAGDVVPMSPDGKQGITVHSLDAPHSMVWGTPGDTSWVWQLDTQPDGTTRLITRIRSRIRWTPMSIAFSGLMELGDFWMIRKMLHGLRERAEGEVAG